MKFLFSLPILSLVSATGATALDFEPMGLGQMVRGAELAIAGTVVAASSESVTLDISDTYFGPDLGDEVTIRRNKDWSGLPGPGIFRDGQRVVVFARQTGKSTKAAEPDWRTLGIENEAVLPVDDGTAYFTGSMPGDDAVTRDLGGLSVSGHPLNLADFAMAVPAFRECAAPIAQNRASGQAEIQCSDSALEALTSQTELGRFLIEAYMQE